MFSLNVALLAVVQFGLALWRLCYEVLLLLSAFVLAMTILFGSLVWHLARMCFVQVDRLKRCCCCLRGLHYDSFFFFFFWVTG